MGLVVFGITATAFSYSARNEYRTKFPEEGRFFPSRWYVTVPHSSAERIVDRFQVEQTDQGTRSETEIVRDRVQSGVTALQELGCFQA